MGACDRSEAGCLPHGFETAAKIATGAPLLRRALSHAPARRSTPDSVWQWGRDHGTKRRTQTRCGEAGTHRSQAQCTMGTVVFSLVFTNLVYSIARPPAPRHGARSRHRRVARPRARRRLARPKPLAMEHGY